MAKRKSWPIDDAFTRASKKMNRAMYGDSSRSRTVHHHHNRRRGPRHVITEDYESYRQRTRRQDAITLQFLLLVILFGYMITKFGVNTGIIFTIIIVILYFKLKNQIYK